MAGTLRSRKRRNLDDNDHKTTKEEPAIEALGIDSPSSDIEIYSKEVLQSLITDNLPPTPNNFSLYFDRLLEEKSDTLRKQIHSMLELEESNDAESTIALEQSLKQGFGSIKNLLGVTANLYKNMSVMTKILEKRKKELEKHTDTSGALGVIENLNSDITKLNDIVKTQNTQMKSIYDKTAKIVKSVESETIFDNQFGVYNKRYLLTKLEQEIEMIKQFKHQSSLIMVELSHSLTKEIKNEKAVILMTRTIARLLLKTSRRSDIVAHYGNGIFSMLLKHTDIESAKKASERLSDLVSSSNFFLADREIQLSISIGVTNIDSMFSVDEIVVSALNGVDKSHLHGDVQYMVSLNIK